ncbi:MAG TPA: MarR family transcriptional regulator [Steroidobacteraceae bacterium]|nr:MarR family transcriptional regulator [Steroidobacteraceae bacterium]
MSAEGGEARERLRREALRAARALVDRMRERYRELERASGAPIAAHRVLGGIAAAPGIAASKLAQQLGMNRPAMSQALRALEERGWIRRRRDPHDGRSVQLHLTESGMALLRSTAGRASGTLERCIRALPDAQLRTAAAGLAALVRRLPRRMLQRPPQRPAARAQSAAGPAAPRRSSGA